MITITYKQLNKLHFPVYKLFEPNIWEEDGLVICNGLILDDRNMDGGTLGTRRFQTSHEPLYRLNQSINSMSGMIKEYHKAYIDSKGVIIKYEKTRFCPVKYKKIKRIEKKEIASIVWLEGVQAPFLVPRPPNDYMTHAGIIYLYNAPWLLYEYAEGFKSEYRRKV